MGRDRAYPVPLELEALLRCVRDHGAIVKGLEDLRVSHQSALALSVGPAVRAPDAAIGDSHQFAASPVLSAKSQEDHRQGSRAPTRRAVHPAGTGGKCPDLHTDAQAISL